MVRGRCRAVVLEDGVDGLGHECLGGLFEFDAEHAELLVRGRSRRCWTFVDGAVLAEPSVVRAVVFLEVTECSGRELLGRASSRVGQ